MSKKESTKTLIASNKKAFHNVQIEERLECGVVLVGCEVKSIRNKNVTIKDSYARIIRDELFLFNAYIGPYEQGNRQNPNPTRDRKLLVHKKELLKIKQKIETKGYIMVPISIYIRNGKVKVECGIGSPKKNHDKRADIKDRDIKRNLDRAVKQTR